MFPKKSRFTEMLIAENDLDQSGGFDCWLFCRGMLFNSPDKWWGDHGRRDYPHEGIDLCLYNDRCGARRQMDANTRIPVLHDGVVRAIFKDYLGRAVIIEHEYDCGNSARFISFYAHTKPRPDIEVGRIVKKGEVIATLADTANSKSKIKAHLHLSFGFPSDSFSYEGFVWNTVRDPEMIILQDPLAVIDWPYQMLDDDNCTCREL
jgi:murein DD-endopeptidase MepM/ murein hydrolase activator NlpD